MTHLTKGTQSSYAPANAPARPMRILHKRDALVMSRMMHNFRPGDGYRDWYDDGRNLVRTALGPVPG